MITIDNKIYRNLEEQVQKNKDDIEYLATTGSVLNEFGLKVIDEVTFYSYSETKPTITATNQLIMSEDVNENKYLYISTETEGAYEWTQVSGTNISLLEALYTNIAFGDTFAGQFYVNLGGGVIRESHYLLTYTRANTTHANNYLFSLGQFPLQGVKGDTGSTGATGATGATALEPKIGYEAETVSTGDAHHWINIGNNFNRTPVVNDYFLCVIDATVSNKTYITTQVITSVVDSNAYSEVVDLYDITGAQGIQGNPGTDGAKGDKGDKGDTGNNGITPKFKYEVFNAGMTVYYNYGSNYWNSIVQSNGSMYSYNGASGESYVANTVPAQDTNNFVLMASSGSMSLICTRPIVVSSLDEFTVQSSIILNYFNRSPSYGETVACYLSVSNIQYIAKVVCNAVGSSTYTFTPTDWYRLTGYDGTAGNNGLACKAVPTVLNAPTVEGVVSLASTYFSRTPVSGEGCQAFVQYGNDTYNTWLYVQSTTNFVYKYVNKIEYTGGSALGNWLPCSVTLSSASGSYVTSDVVTGTPVVNDVLYDNTGNNGKVTQIVNTQEVLANLSENTTYSHGLKFASTSTITAALTTLFTTLPQGSYVCALGEFIPDGASGALNMLAIAPNDELSSDVYCLVLTDDEMSVSETMFLWASADGAVAGESVDEGFNTDYITESGYYNNTITTATLESSVTTYLNIIVQGITTVGANYYYYNKFGNFASQDYVNSKGLPTKPTTDGQYSLRCTVTNGVATLSWVLNN